MSILNHFNGQELTNDQQELLTELESFLEARYSMKKTRNQSMNTLRGSLIVSPTLTPTVMSLIPSILLMSRQ